MTTYTEDDLMEIHRKFWDKISRMSDTEAMEVRFHMETYRGEIRKYQFIASPNGKGGSIYYSVNEHPRTSHYSISLSSLIGIKDNDAYLPMKSYTGWQHDVFAWLMGLPYTITEVF